MENRKQGGGGGVRGRRHFIALHSTSLLYIELHSFIVHSTALHYVALHYIILHSMELYSSELHSIALTLQTFYKKIFVRGQNFSLEILRKKKCKKYT